MLHLAVACAVAIAGVGQRIRTCVRRTQVEVTVVVRVELFERAGDHVQAVQLLGELHRALRADHRLLCLAALLLFQR